MKTLILRSSLSAILLLTFLMLPAQTWELINKSLPVPYLNNSYYYFGRTVCISGDYAVVGSAVYDFNQACVYVLHYNGDIWETLAELTASDNGADDYFGNSVCISDDNIVVGAYTDYYFGSAYVFEKPISGWESMTETAILTASSGQYIGNSVSISGDNIVVGAHQDGYGSAYVFEKPVSGWVSMTETAKLTASDSILSYRFGSIVSISDDNIVVGAHHDTNSGSARGSAYVFEKPVSGWASMTETAKLTASDGAAFDLFGNSVSISGDIVIVGAQSDDDKGTDSGSAYIFEKPVSGWVSMTEIAKLTASDGAATDQFGLSVSISGDNIIVGAFYDDDMGFNSGSAYVFEKPVSGWVSMTETAKLTASDGTASDQFGLSVSISGDNIIVGANRDDDNGDCSGSAYVFEKPVSGWASMTETQKILPLGESNISDDYAYSVAVSGNYAVVGAYGYKINQGCAYVLHYNGDIWVTLAKLTASDNNINRLGYSVSISGDNVVVGAYYDDDNGYQSGSAYVFEKPVSGWVNMTETAKLTASDGAVSNQLGKSVGISGDNIIVGASGSAYVFEKPVSGWTNMTETAKLTASDGVSSDQFAQSVSISGDNIIVGASSDDDKGTNSGSAYVFEKPVSGWASMTETAKLTASEGAASDYFGISVSISNNNIIVGAYYDDDNDINSGSAYVFEKPVSGWVSMTEIAKLTASDGTDNDYLGKSVSISGDNIIVGANRDNVNDVYTGSAYVFEKPVSGWVSMTETAKLTAFDGADNDYFGESVSISGYHIIVGAYSDDDNGESSGSAYCFDQTSPYIVSQPVNQSDICSGIDISFSLTGNNIDTYQWQESTDAGLSWSNLSDNAIYSGSLTSELIITTEISLNDNQYCCYLTNEDGNITSDTAILTFETEAPVPDVTTLDDITAECGVSISTIPTATDNCEGTISATTTDPLIYTAQDTYIITWTYVDGSGNISNQTQNVVIDDVTAPIPDNASLDDITAECGVTVSTIPTATDNCEGTIIGTTTDPLTYSTQGTYIITWSYDDGNGNILNQTQNVVIDDVTSPIADVTTLADITAECGVEVSTTPTATDNCVGTIIGTTTDPLTYSTQGTYIITWSYDDGNGNTSNQTQNVVIDDVTAPIADVTTLDDITAECGVTVYEIPTATDNCEGTIIGTTTDPLTYSTQGTYIITWSYDDGNGNILNQTQTVVIDDVTAPIADVTTLADITAECGVEVSTTPTATDNCEGTIIGTTTDPLTYSTQGTYIITWSYDDGNGNILNQTQNVVIDDVTSPTEDVTTLADITAECGVEVSTTPTATDNCVGTIIGTTTDPLTYSTQGTYIITWSYDDGNGNTSNQTQNVIINDVMAPIPDNATLADITAECEVSVSETPTATDNCEGTIIGTTTDPLTYSTQGTYIITWSYDDGNGNTSNQTQTVIVDDISVPIADVITLDDITVECEVTVTETPTATDNCEGTIIGTTTDPLTYSTQGTYIITWSYDDGNGNTSNQTQNIVIDDVTAPTITCVGNQNADADGSGTYTVQGADLDPLAIDDNCEVLYIENNLNGNLTLDGTQFPVGTTQIIWTVTDIANNISTCSFNIEVSEYVIRDEYLSEEIKVYPNPTSGSFTIETPKNYRVQIVDIQGKIIGEYKCRNSELRVDLTNNSHGIYFIKFFNNSDIYIYKLVKI